MGCALYQLCTSEFCSSIVAHDAAKAQQRRGTLQQYNATFDMLLSDTADQFHAFMSIEVLLKSPVRMANQIEVQIQPEVQAILIERYSIYKDEFIYHIAAKR